MRAEGDERKERDLSLPKVNYLITSLVINKIHWCVAGTDIHAKCDLLLHGRPSNCWWHSTSHRPESQILVQNRDFCLSHIHSTRGFPSEHCCDASYR